MSVAVKPKQTHGKHCSAVNGLTVLSQKTKRGFGSGGTWGRGGLALAAYEAARYMSIESAKRPRSFNRLSIWIWAPTNVTPYTDVITVCFTSFLSICQATPETH
jgi:hypothetical protein